MRKWLVGISLYLCCSFSGASQTPAVSLKATPTKILVGDYVTIDLTIKYPQHTQVTLPSLNGFIGTLEVVEAHSPDTVLNGESITLHQQIIASAYDSGTYSAGPLKIFYTHKHTDDSVLSNEVTIHSTTIAIDTTQPFKPIKSPIEISVHWSEFLYYIMAAVLLLLAVLLFFFLRNKPQHLKEAIVPEERVAPKEAAHVWALRELGNLQAEKLWQSNETKAYYSRLTDILRLYLEYRYSWQAIESTTEEIEMGAPQYIHNEKAEESLLEVLRIADRVKFAKANPLPETNMAAMDNAQKFVEQTKHSEEATLN